MAGGLDFDVRRRDGQVTIAVRGDVDLQTAPQLQECLVAHGDANVTVDLAEVGFLDSSGLSVLALAWRRAHDDGHRLRVVNEGEFVQRVFEIAGLETILHGAGEDEGARAGQPSSS
jgi:anti-sigma B factor antagonist